MPLVSPSARIQDSEYSSLTNLKNGVTLMSRLQMLGPDMILKLALTLLLVSAAGALIMRRYASKISLQTRFLLLLWVFLRAGVIIFLVDYGLVFLMDRIEITLFKSWVSGAHFYILLFLIGFFITHDLKGYGIEIKGWLGIGGRMALILTGLTLIIAPIIVVATALIHR